MAIRSDHEIVAIAERHYGVRFRQVASNEYRSLNGCPKCGDGGKGSRSDRFRLFIDEHPLVWCRRCDFREFIDQIDGSTPTREDILERRMRAMEARQQEQERRLSALEKMHQCTDHIQYYHNVDFNEQAYEYWLSEGMDIDTIAEYKLGYCLRCPTDYAHRPSYTIPVIIGGKLYNIRHRLIGGDQSDKYRPHMKGLPNVLFNADYLYQDNLDHILITEGEKKSIIAARYGFPNVGIMGKAGFDRTWAVKFKKFERVSVALDPDATDKAADIAKLFRGCGRVVRLPAKLDDMIVKYGATKEDIRWFIEQGVKI